MDRFRVTSILLEKLSTSYGDLASAKVRRVVHCAKVTALRSRSASWVRRCTCLVTYCHAIEHDVRHNHLTDTPTLPLSDTEQRSSQWSVLDTFLDIPWIIMTYYIILSYPTLPYLTLLYLASPHLTSPYLTLPYLTLPYLTLPYLTLPYLTLPYLTLPYLTLPYLTLP